MSTIDTYEARFEELIEATANYDLHSDDATKAFKNLETYSKSAPKPPPEPEPIPDPVPTTRWEKFKHGSAKVWDNETTRVFIKAGGAFAGVAIVAYSTIHRDHNLERQAMNQANQRPS